MSDLHRNAEKTLKALHELGGRANTQELVQRTGLTSSNISGTHAQTLLREDLIEKDGTEDVGAPVEANVYKLTYEGELLADSLELELNVDDLSEELVQQDRQITNLQEQVSALEAEVDRVQDNQRELRDVVEQLVERL
jgi:chromosome segregation ATPase